MRATRATYCCSKARIQPIKSSNMGMSCVCQKKPQQHNNGSDNDAAASDDDDGSKTSHRKMPRCLLSTQIRQRRLGPRSGAVYHARWYVRTFARTHARTHASACWPVWTVFGCCSSLARCSVVGAWQKAVLARHLCACVVCLPVFVCVSGSGFHWLVGCVRPRDRQQAHSHSTRRRRFDCIRKLR